MNTFIDTTALELDAWLAPLTEHDACGPDLEYDPDFLELARTTASRPVSMITVDADADAETEAESVNWQAVRQTAEALNERTRDLRVARWWLRARLRTEGFAALPAGLVLMTRLMEQWWDELHPRLDDGDPIARASVLREFADTDGLLGDVRQALVLDNRKIGQVSVRDIEIARGRLAPRDARTPLSELQIEQMLRDGLADDPGLAGRAAGALQALQALETLLSERTRTLSAQVAPNFTALRKMLEVVDAMSPAATAPAHDDTFDFGLDGGADRTDDAAADDTPLRPRRGADGEIASRADAVAAIERICQYLQTHEPTNPAQQLLRRAQRLIDLDFLQLVREFAPGAVDEVARMLGVATHASETTDL